MDSPFTFICKSFNSLALNELYEILALRQKVFVVEQNCPYQDCDNNDQHAFHLLGHDEDSNIIGYSRILPQGVSYPNYCSIGRIATHPAYRNQNLGNQIMQESIKHCQNLFGGASAIKISAQAHLMKFYSKHGFVSTGHFYLEDGIPHCGMILDLSKKS